MERLRRSRDVQRALGAQRPTRGRYVRVHCRRRGDDGPSRATVVAGRKVGSAVRRNRAKRRLRAAVASVKAPKGCDIVVVARPGAEGAPFGELRAEVERGVDRRGQEVNRG